MKLFHVVMLIKTASGEVISCEYKTRAETEGLAVQKTLEFHGAKLHQCEKFRVAEIKVG